MAKLEWIDNNHNLYTVCNQQKQSASTIQQGACAVGLPETHGGIEILLTFRTKCAGVHRKIGTVCLKHCQ